MTICIITMTLYTCLNSSKSMQWSSSLSASFIVRRTIESSYVRIKKGASNYYMQGDFVWGDNRNHQPVSLVCVGPPLHSAPVIICGVENRFYFSKID